MKTDAQMSVKEAVEAARFGSSLMSSLSGEVRNRALMSIAESLENNASLIAAENAVDMENARLKVESGELQASLYQRLKMDNDKIRACAKGIRQLAGLPDPLGQIELARELDQELTLYRVSSPIGVVAVIFESRPDAMPQILSLCLKSGNAVILKGGKEAEKSNRVLFRIMQEAAYSAGVPSGSLSLIETRADVTELLKSDAFVDLIIPRGSGELVRYIQNNTRIPVLGHADGICHVYVHEDADLRKAKSIVLDAKLQYPSACNALETLLIHEKVLPRFLPDLVSALQKENVELRLDAKSNEVLKKLPQAERAKLEIDLEKLKDASEADWSTEYCDLILSIKTVTSLQDAIEHINRYGSGHTEAMLSQSPAEFAVFFDRVNSAGIYLNASTRFADGYRYGFGAEVGISTSKLHPRGPVGLEGLLSYKYKLIGNGQIVADYTGENAREFKHRDLDV